MAMKHRREVAAGRCSGLVPPPLYSLEADRKLVTERFRVPADYSVRSLSLIVPGDVRCWKKPALSANLA
jgi:hypothetical protein